jgi:mycothiol maleylpyruvate isomerase-like protein
MRHSREGVIERTVREFELLDQVVSTLSDEQWALPLLRSETKDPWTVKDGLAHITHWKADSIRVVRRRRRPPEERGLAVNAGNRLVYERWRERPARDVLAWHREVQEDALRALREAPEAWFSGRERGPQWPFDLVGHSAEHRLRDIERVVAGATTRG